MNGIELIETYINNKYDLKENLINGFIYCKEKNEDQYHILNENSLWRELQHERFKFGINDLVNLLKSNFTKKYDPIADYFKSLPESTHDWIFELTKFIKVTGDQQKFNDAFKKHLVRTVACALDEKIFNKHCLVLVGPKQSTGKTTFCRWLCPPALQSYFAENITTDKDSLLALSENFLINLDELSTLQRAEINALKAVFSKDYVKVRKPYERKPCIAVRRASFIGSTNRQEFLNDESGSVRWLCFEVENINWGYQLSININNVWARAYKLFKENYKFNMDAIEVSENEQRNQSYSITSIEADLIAKAFEPAKKDEPGARFFSASDILIELNNNFNVKGSLHIINIGKAMTVLNFEKSQHFNNQLKFQQKGYWVKPLLSR